MVGQALVPTFGCAPSCVWGPIEVVSNPNELERMIWKMRFLQQIRPRHCPVAKEALDLEERRNEWAISSLQKALTKWKSPGVVAAGEVPVIICLAGSGMALLPQPPHSQPHVLRDVTLLHHLHLFLALCPRSRDSRRSYSTGNHGCAPSWPQA